MRARRVVGREGVGRRVCPRPCGCILNALCVCRETGVLTAHTQDAFFIFTQGHCGGRHTAAPSTYPQKRMNIVLSCLCQGPGEPGSRTREHQDGRTRKHQDDMENVKNWAEQHDGVPRGSLVAVVDTPASIRSAVRLTFSSCEILYQSIVCSTACQR